MLNEFYLLRYNALHSIGNNKYSANVCRLILQDLILSKALFVDCVRIVSCLPYSSPMKIYDMQ